MIVRIYKWQLILLFGVAGVFGFVLGRTLKEQVGGSVQGSMNRIQGKKNPITAVLDRSLFAKENGGTHKLNEVGYMMRSTGQEKYCRINAKPLRSLEFGVRGLVLKYDAQTSQFLKKFHKNTSLSLGRSGTLKWFEQKKGQSYEICKGERSYALNNERRFSTASGGREAAH